MRHSGLSSEEIVRWGEAIYRERLRDKVETPDNLGKIIIIDLETGDYEVDADGLAANKRALAKHPTGVLCGLRIGYDVVEEFNDFVTHCATN